jgi:hypothetical protein
MRWRRSPSPFRGTARAAAGRKQPRPQQEYALSYILPAVREPGDDENAPVTQQEFVTPYGLPVS